MAELTKIFTGMEKGPEAIDANFTQIGPYLKQSQYTISNSNNTLASDKITNLNGIITRVGNVVFMNMHAEVSDYGTGPALDFMYLPVGYAPDNISASQYPLALEQNSATVTVTRAFLYPAAKGTVLSAKAIKGNVYISGSWTTSDDFPN